MAVSNFCKAWVQYCVHAKLEEQLEEGYQKMEEFYPSQKYAWVILYIQGLNETKKHAIFILTGVSLQPNAVPQLGMKRKEEWIHVKKEIDV